jgi:hypothetical protein
MKRKSFIALATVVILVMVTACQPKTIVVEKTVVVPKIITQVVKETVKETVVVEGKPQVVEKEVTKVIETEIEVVVTATPEPTQVALGGTAIESTFADAEILNPILSTDDASNDVNSYLYNALVELDPQDASVKPDLAESWEVSDDGLTFTYHLFEDVRWHDGEPFTAHDVKFTYEAILNEDVNSPRRADFVDILTPDQIVVIDDYTVQFQLGKIDPTWLCCKDIYGIIPQHILGDLTPEEFNTAEFNTLSPIGTGPFMFREWVKDDHVALVKNPDYFKDGPNLDFMDGRGGPRPGDGRAVGRGAAAGAPGVQGLSQLWLYVLRLPARFGKIPAVPGLAHPPGDAFGARSAGDGGQHHLWPG